DHRYVRHYRTRRESAGGPAGRGHVAAPPVGVSRRQGGTRRIAGGMHCPGNPGRTRGGRCRGGKAARQRARLRQRQGDLPRAVPLPPAEPRVCPQGAPGGPVARPGRAARAGLGAGRRAHRGRLRGRLRKAPAGPRKIRTFFV
ncbi:MAG: hypothetical protein AVDCRST_MAG56-2669, partial [uncultured Cytophagales bacterium]